MSIAQPLPVTIEDELIAIDPSIMALAMQRAAEVPLDKTLIDSLSKEDWLAGDDGKPIECGTLKPSEE